MNQYNLTSEKLKLLEGNLKYNNSTGFALNRWIDSK